MEQHFPIVLSNLHIEGKSGVLHVKEGETSYRFYLDKGRIIGLASSKSEESLSQMIIQSGMISPWDVELAQEVVSANKGRSLGNILVDMGLAQQELIIEQLNKKLEQTLIHLFNVSHVENSFSEEPPPSGWTIVPTKTTADLLLEGARALQSPMAIDSLLGDPEKYVCLSQDVRLRYQQANTNKLEKTILHHAAKSPRIARFANAKSTQVDRFDLFKSIFGLTIAGLLEITDQPQQRDSLSLPRPDKQAEVTRQMVVEKFKGIGIQEPEAFLELPRKYTTEELKDKYNQLLSRYHPDQSARETLSDLTHQLEAIFLELTHCYNYLTTDRGKPSPEKEKEIKEEKKGSGLEDTVIRLRTGSTNYQYALQMLSQRKLPEAMSSIQLAVENDPGNSFFLFKMAQILRRAPGKQKEAELAYRKAMDLDPLNTDILTDLATLYWENDMKSKAKSIIKQAFDIDPSNKRIQKFWDFLQAADRPFPLKEIVLFLGALLLGLFLGTMM